MLTTVGHLDIDVQSMLLQQLLQGACVKWLCHLVICLHVTSTDWYSVMLCAPARVLTSGAYLQRFWHLSCDAFCQNNQFVVQVSGVSVESF